MESNFNCNLSFAIWVRSSRSSINWLSSSTLRRIMASAALDSVDWESSVCSASNAAITGVSGVRNSCESMARKLSLVRFAASTAAFCCAMAASARLRSAIAAASAMAVTVNTAVEVCRMSRDWFSVSITKGPKPCSVPQIAIAERRKIPVAVSRWAKRKAVHNTTGPQMNETG